ncbi:general secretion pathway protein GspB [Vogesella sp. LYT5W]|uniref:General secretion pathway protein GspB n=1 Tax=Vogesella margarita TaxID=2984199 RepID=A0ABT5IMV8_9NEIS|nr:general secretion pathway protein GspB [Vogesella margarita]MDC7713918.1 general secretion pathway protein GspB [Vogesella margarita]
MSYILDALLKADQERQRHSTPTVHSIHAAQSPQPLPGKPRWRYLLLTLLLGSGIAAAGMLFGWQALASIQPATPHAADSHPHALRGDTAPPAETKAVSLPPVERAPLAIPGPAEAVAMRPTLPDPTASAHKEHRVAAASKPTAKTVAPPAAASDATPAVSRIDNKVFNLHELPAALQKEIGDTVVISGFSSSGEGTERLVIINDRVRRAGDDVVAGMKLETIQADGVILNYKGYRFRTGSY